MNFSKMIFGFTCCLWTKSKKKTNKISRSFCKGSTIWFQKISLKQRPYATFNAFYISKVSSTQQGTGLNKTVLKLFSMFLQYLAG